MSNIDRDELEEKIDYQQEGLDRVLELWDQTPQDRKPYSQLGMSNRRIAIYTLLLGNLDEAAKRFGKGAEGYHLRREQLRGGGTEPQMQLWALLCAILSKDEETRTLVADAGPVEYTKPKYFAQFDACLLGLLQGDDQMVREAADYLENHESSAYNVEYYTGLGTACCGLVDGDEPKFEKGLETILGRHESLLPKYGATMDDGLVCFPATALVRLAYERGMDLSELAVYGNEYVPWEYVEHD